MFELNLLSNLKHKIKEKLNKRAFFHKMLVNKAFCVISKCESSSYNFSMFFRIKVKSKSK